MEEKKTNESKWNAVYSIAKPVFVFAVILYGVFSLYQYYFYPATPDELKKIIMEKPCSAKVFHDFLAENKFLSNSDASDLAYKCQKAIDEEKEEAINNELIKKQKAAVEQASAEINKEWK
ncbi:hypothetical protein NL493_25600 [Klebsiella pneumoniae]|nr:hypothetical protein [Klebsiella pneumoniae]